MSKTASRKISDGDLQPHPHKKSQSGARKYAHKLHRQLKSNIPNKAKSRNAEVISPSNGESEEEEGDSSAIEEQTSTVDEPDAHALSGALQQPVGKAAKRLAGPIYDDDDMFQDPSMTDEMQVVAGAERDGDESDDDDYAEVENMSDSDESEDETGERNVLRSAERDLIDEFERTEERRNANNVTFDMNDMTLHEDEALARRSSLQGSDSQNDEFGFAINMNEDPFYGFPKDDSIYADMWDEAESALWRMPATVRDRDGSDPSTTQKRVRFEEIFSRSSSKSVSEDPGEAFPDLFTASDDPAVKQRIALGMEQDTRMNDFLETDSFYDFEDEDEKLAFQVDEESDSDDDQRSDTTEDEGDTTDEETREEQIARMQERKAAVGRAQSSTPSTPLPAKRILPSSTRTSTPRPTTPKDCKGPKAGTFVIDPTRATMTTDAEGRKIKLLPPAKPVEKDRAFWERAKTANSSCDGSPGNSYLTIPSPGAESIPARPFTAQSTLGSMFNGNLDILRNNDVAGIADDMFPAAMVQSQSSFATMTTSENSDTEQQDINMQDFIDLDDSDSESDGQSMAAIASPPETDMFSSFTSDGGHNERRGSGLLEHFDQCRGVVGSFRRNQHHAKHVSSLPSHPAKRASAHEYNALQKGRRGAANTPITPARKKRVSQDLTSNKAGIRKSLNSPLAMRRPRSRGNSLAGISNSDLYQTLTRSPFE